MFARARQRPDLAELFERPAVTRMHDGRAVRDALDALPRLVAPAPQITDEVMLWFSGPVVRALNNYGIRTLAELTVRVPRRRHWWKSIPRLGLVSAWKIEAFFAAQPELTERARRLIAPSATPPVVPWEYLLIPKTLDGSQGTFRGRKNQCTLSAKNDSDAVQAWLQLHDAQATQRSYRKEVERFILWAIIERGRPLSSMTTEDALAYRVFLHHPAPRSQWTGPPCPHTSPEWRPFAGPLSPRSTAYALSVLTSMYRWLVDQGYLVANPFAGVRVRYTRVKSPIDVSRMLTDGEWVVVRGFANELEQLFGWHEEAAHRLRFILDFEFATGLRVSELASARLKDIRLDDNGDSWIQVVGKGTRQARVGLPPLAIHAKDEYLVQRENTSGQSRLSRNSPLVGSLHINDEAGISATRLRRILRRFFLTAADPLEADHPELAEKLRHASPHWLRHTHASHALAHGVDLIKVRDNLRHASVSTTSVYLHTEDVARAAQLKRAFPVSSQTG